MNKANRGKMDLGVAFGIALIGSEKKYYRTPMPEVVSNETEWFDYQYI
jgi:hypothetical protein